MTELRDYLIKVAHSIPDGLRDLRDVVTMATMDINVFLSTGFENRDLEKALTFAQSIPKVDDMDGEVMTHWMINDMTFQDYWKLQ